MNWVPKNFINTLVSRNLIGLNPLFHNIISLHDKFDRKSLQMGKTTQDIVISLNPLSQTLFLLFEETERNLYKSERRLRAFLITIYCYGKLITTFVA